VHARITAFGGDLSLAWATVFAGGVDMAVLRGIRKLPEQEQVSRKWFEITGAASARPFVKLCCGFQRDHCCGGKVRAIGCRVRFLSLASDNDRRIAASEFFPPLRCEGVGRRSPPRALAFVSSRNGTRGENEF